MCYYIGENNPHSRESEIYASLISFFSVFGTHTLKNLCIQFCVGKNSGSSNIIFLILNIVFIPIYSRA